MSTFGYNHCFDGQTPRNQDNDRPPVKPPTKSKEWKKPEIKQIWSKK